MITGRVLELAEMQAKVRSYLLEIRSEQSILLNTTFVRSAFERMEPLSLHRHEIFNVSGVTYTIGKTVRAGSPVGSRMTDQGFFEAIHDRGKLFVQYARPEIKREFEEIVGAVGRMTASVRLSIPINREIRILPSWDLSGIKAVSATDIRVGSYSPETVEVRLPGGHMLTFSSGQSQLLLLFDEFEAEFVSLYENMLTTLKECRRKNDAEERVIEKAIGRLVLVGLARDGSLDR